MRLRKKRASRRVKKALHGTTVDNIPSSIVAALVPSTAYEAAIVEVCGLLEHAVGDAFGPDAWPLVFGSLLQGCHLPDSDLDVCVHVQGHAQASRSGEWDNQRQVVALRRLLSKLPSKLSVVETRFSKHIRVPIVVLSYCSSGGQHIEVDVSIGTGCDGLCKGSTDRIVRRLLARVPRAIPLVRLVKAWARSEGLNKAFDGFLNSLGWTLLVLFFCIRQGCMTLDMMDDEEDHELDRLPPPLDCKGPEAPAIMDVIGFFDMVSNFRLWLKCSADSPRGVSLVDGMEVDGHLDERSPFFLEDPAARLILGRTENVARALREDTWRAILRKCRSIANSLRTKEDHEIEPFLLSWLPKGIKKSMMGTCTRAQDLTQDKRAAVIHQRVAKQVEPMTRHIQSAPTRVEQNTFRKSVATLAKEAVAAAASRKRQMVLDLETEEPLARQSRFGLLRSESVRLEAPDGPAARKARPLKNGTGWQWKK